jgi:hypothetical protein
VRAAILPLSGQHLHRTGLLRIVPASLLACLCASAPAQAHIKWFEPFDITQAPRPISEVLGQEFILFFLASVAFVFVFFAADRWAYRRRILVAFDEGLRRFDGLSVLIMRLAAAVFFTSLWTYGVFGSQPFYLTPELHTDSIWVPWFQLAIAGCALFRRTLPLVGPGIAVLYAAALADYGLYHLLDYLVFLGIAYFFATATLPARGWRKSGFVTLYAITGINFLWLAIEKFAYPAWTYPLLDKHPNILLGMDPQFYMLLAGFVEFVLIFILFAAASVVTRLVAFGLLSVFVLAIFEFGMIDAVGHLMIIAILFILIVRGPTDARNILVLPTKSPQMEAYFMTGLYYLAFVNAFLLYYGLHYLLV